MRKRAQSFTLVELLVVVAILAVLASLLLPALKSARERGKTTKCASNQRQVGAGMFAFLGDHNGYYPYGNPVALYDCPTPGPLWENPPGNVICPASPGTNYVANLGWSAAYVSPWTYAISRYMNPAYIGYGGVWACPSNPWPFPTTGAGGYSVSYQMNGQMFPNNFYNVCGSGAFGGFRRRIRVTDISAPAKVFFVGEKPYVNGANPYSFYPYSAGGINLITPANCGDMSANAFGKPPLAPYLTNYNYSIYAAWWHNWGMNSLYVDGHVERNSYATLTNYTADLVKGPIYAGNGSAGAYFWNDNLGNRVPYENQQPDASYGRQWMGE